MNVIDNCTRDLRKYKVEIELSRDQVEQVLNCKKLPEFTSALILKEVKKAVDRSILIKS